MSELNPCPFCHSGETRIDENKYWTGQRYVLSSVELRHWCHPQEDSYVRQTITIRARTTEQAVKVWNERKT